MIELPEHKELILFDGICNLCNNSIQYIIKRDIKNKFMFAPLQSDAGKELISEYNIDTSQTDSIILYQPNKGISIKSTAALRIAKSLKFPSNLSVIFMIIPVFIRNWVYDYIAKNRYKWYGKRETCMIPTQELNSKFLQ